MIFLSLKLDMIGKIVNGNFLCENYVFVSLNFVDFMCGCPAVRDLMGGVRPMHYRPS